MSSAKSSRSRFVEYRAERKKAKPDQAVSHEAANEKRKKAPRTRGFMDLASSFWMLLRGHRVMVMWSLLTLSVSTGLGLLMPASTKLVIDYLLTTDPWPDDAAASVLNALGGQEARRTLLVWVSLGLIVVAVLSAGVALWGRWQCTRIAMRLRVGLRKKAFERAAQLPLTKIHELKSGGAAGLLREDAGGVGDLVFSMIYNPWRAITQFIGTVTILALIDWRLLISATLLVPLIVFTHKTWIVRIRPMFRDVRATRQVIDGQSTEVFAGMRIVRGFNRASSEAGRFTTGNHFMARQELMTWWWSRILEIVWQILIPVASAGVLLYGGLGVMDGTLTVGDLMMFSFYLAMLLGPLEALVASATNIQNNLAGFDRALDLLREPKEFEDSEGTVVLDRSAVQGRVTLEGVSFRYPSPTSEPDRMNPLVIEEISIDVKPGETIALVGPSGAGKTTLCNLIARFYDPVAGLIRLDGRDLRDIAPDSFRSLLGIVEQDVFLFDGTIAENIGYGRRGATDDDIAAAARAANADGFVGELEHGYDTIVGERGVRLSGGQKQRIAIARAILADPKILILDEATSSLDTESERLIQRSLARLMEGRTSFVIAHRLSTIRHANRIVVIEQGRIREIGSHDELAAKGGRYAELLAAQLEDPRSAKSRDAE